LWLLLRPRRLLQQLHLLRCLDGSYMGPAILQAAAALLLLPAPAAAGSAGWAARTLHLTPLLVLPAMPAVLLAAGSFLVPAACWAAMTSVLLDTLLCMLPYTPVSAQQAADSCLLLRAAVAAGPPLLLLPLLLMAAGWLLQCRS
jgi:hypothetical protein